MAEGRLSMLDPDPRARGPHPRDRDVGAAARRVRPLATCAVLAVALHLAFLDHLAGWHAAPGEATSAPLSVRTIAVEPPAAVPVVESPPTAAVAAPSARRAPRLRPRSPKSIEANRPTPLAEALPSIAEASAGSAASDPMASSTAADVDPAVGAAADAASAAAAAAAAAQAAASEDLGVAAAIPGSDRPPPVYPTRLPPPATIHYQVRRGFLRGDGEIRWQPAGDSYRLLLEARVAGWTLLVQTSEGAIDGNGLAPVRFLDQRARRPAQAANFVRDGGRITYSATAAQWPLFAGSQDRLSWMIQLAGIVAADPALLREGSRITMAVVGARGDAALWSLRYVGRETVETAIGSVSAEKLVREGRSANDTTAEIWLDPERSYLPAHATLRSASGASEYDLLLDRIDP